MNAGAASRSNRAWWRRKRTWWGLYLGLLLLHHAGTGLGGWGRPPEGPAPGESEATVEVAGVGPVRVVYRDVGPVDAPVLLLLHGSPGSLHDFDAVVREWNREGAPALRVLVPDLPGFGRSQHDMPSYSLRTHAEVCRALLESLGAPPVHVVGYSMGGGVALDLVDLAPERVASLTLLAGLGVQELELLGDYRLNHLVHAAQLAGIWALENLVPHFGRFTGFPLDSFYARNFYDSDQRPLRGVLRELQVPTLIVHSPEDPLVPWAAAREHHRLVPQSELVSMQGSHFMVWTRPAEVARALAEFVERVQAGQAPTRAQATPERVAAAAEPWSAQSSPRAHGIAKVVLVFLLVLGTFLTEDLTSVAAGLLIAQGRLSWSVGLGAVFCGIYFGDLLLYALGRGLGRAVLHRRPWRWIVHAEDLDRASRWFEKRGWMAILVSRFVPGTRLPTYVAAGVVRASFWRFALYFLLAVVLWTPFLVGLSAWLGQAALERFEAWRSHTLWIFAAVAAAVLVVVRGVVPLATWRGRRRALGRWRRLVHWEFWPRWAFYPPLVGYLLWRAPRYGGLRTLSAVNPAMPASGIVGESKGDILEGLGAGPRVARTLRLDAELPPQARWERFEEFRRRERLEYPVVVKPDVGERGQGVRIVRDEIAARAALDAMRADHLVQEFVPGLEYGVFYVREPGQARGRIFSITEKHRPVLRGDGEHTVEHLILADERAVCQAELHLRTHGKRLDEVLAEDEVLELVEVGAHARGTSFLDGARLRTPSLEQSLDALSQSYAGFHFGRYDLKVPSEEALREGRDFKVLELNGLTSEATHIYAPGTPWRVAQAVLREQWEIAFRIGAANRAAGAPTVGLGWVLDAWVRQRRPAAPSVRGRRRPQPS